MTSRPTSEEYALLQQTLAAKEVELNEYREQRDALTEVLQVINTSPSNPQPAFDIIADRALMLCGGSIATLTLLEGDILHLVGLSNRRDTNESAIVGIRRNFPAKLNAGVITARVIQANAPVQIPDLSADKIYPESLKVPLYEFGTQSLLAVPLLLEGETIGVISLGRAATGVFAESLVHVLQSFADQAVIAVENARLFNETQDALKRQTATAEVLRVISSSVENSAPVFEKILDSCENLFGADLIGISTRLPDGRWKVVAQRGAFMVPDIGEEGMHGVKLRAGETVHIPDARLESELPSDLQSVLEAWGNYSGVMVPMKGIDEGTGGLWLARIPARPFSKPEIALLETFADQAVIAIENARLFNETQEALERQTATAEILKVISRSATDVQPVFDAISDRARVLTGALGATSARVEGNLLHLAGVSLAGAIDGPIIGAVKQMFPVSVDSEGLNARVVRSRSPIQFPDVAATENYPQDLKQSILHHGGRSALAVPMLRGQEAIGSIMVFRAELGRFPSSIIDLLESFADQAVIAIENARLFNETREALDRQTAISEISQVITESPTNAAPVLDNIVEHAVQLCDVGSASIFLIDGDHLQHVASRGNLATQANDLEPIPIDGHSTLGRSVLEKTAVHVKDIQAVAAEDSRDHELAMHLEYRTVIVAPLLREGEPLGTMMLTRDEVQPFSEKEISLLRTFADQAVIAIENARLFQEIQQKNRELEVASEHKSEFLANMSHELRTPLNAVIGFSEALIDEIFGQLNEKQTEYLKDIHTSGKHLLSLINDILDLSKIEAGRMDLEVEDFDVPAALDNTLTLIRERAQQHGIQLSLTVPPDITEFRADQRKFKQIMLNLLSNAVKFTPDGGRVSVAARMSGDSLQVTVTDTGIGIAESDQEKVFQEFSQASGVYANKQEGTGLGLTLTRRFVELHGGAIEVISKLGEGARFTFILPRQS